MVVGLLALLKDLVPHPLGAASSSVLLLGPPALQPGEVPAQEKISSCSEEERSAQELTGRTISLHLIWRVCFSPISGHKFPTVARRREGSVCGRWVALALQCSFSKPFLP